MAVPDSIRDAFDPEKFRGDGHRLVDAIADALSRWQRREGLALPWRTPEDARAMWARKGFGGADLVDELRRVMAGSTALAHPHYMAHQVPPPLPAAALSDLVVSVLNNGSAVFEMGLVSSPIEMTIIDWMCGLVGYDNGAGGVLTSGGSLGNLTALLAMRQAQAGFDVWQRGIQGGPPLAVVASADAHYSVSRALRILGLGEGGVITAQLDDRHRMTRAAVEQALASAGERRVIGIIAAAGSTATGAMDPLAELADLAEARGLWLHVDAAHGGAITLSPTHRDKLRGIERADSVVWDAHKLLLVPALVTGVLFRRGGRAYDAFAQQASYMFQAAPEEEWWNIGTRTLECTKRMLSISLWATLRVYGEELFAAIVDRLVALGGALGEKVAASDDFEVAVKPELDIVCYRHKGGGLTGAALDAHNRALRQRVVEDGRFYIAGTQLPSGYFLRSAIMNPLIEEGDLDDLLDHLRVLCRA